MLEVEITAYCQSRGSIESNIASELSHGQDISPH